MQTFTSYRVPENDLIDQIDLNLSTSLFGIRFRNPVGARVCIAYDRVIFSIKHNPVKEIQIPQRDLETDILLHVYRKLIHDQAFRIPTNLTGFELLLFCIDLRSPIPVHRFAFIRKDGCVVEINQQNIKIYNAGEKYDGTKRIVDPLCRINLSETR